MIRDLLITIIIVVLLFLTPQIVEAIQKDEPDENVPSSSHVQYIKELLKERKINDSSVPVQAPLVE